MATLHNLDWFFALGTLFFCLSIWALGANDVANSYATSVSSGSLTLLQAGCLAMVTEFIGAMALGQGVTGTIRSGVFSVKPFQGSPGVLILAMVCAGAGFGIFLFLATKFGFPVSTTQSIVGALVGVGIAANISVNWGWSKGSVSQIAASWAIAPTIAAGFGAIIFLSIKFPILNHSDPLKWGFRLIPFYFALTGGILALFVTISGGHGIPTPEQMGAGKTAGIILGTFAGCLIISYVFFMPHFHRRLIKEDPQIRFCHVVLWPLLWKDDFLIPFPAKKTSHVVPDYYKRSYKGEVNLKDEEVRGTAEDATQDVRPISKSDELKNEKDVSPLTKADPATRRADAKALKDVDKLPWIHPMRILVTLKYIFLRGVTQDIISHQSEIAIAMIMSIAHDANDVSNAIGPFTTEYETWISGVASATADTPDWIKAVGGLGLGLGFWTYGYHLMRNLGNKITQHSPTRS